MKITYRLGHITALVLVCLSLAIPASAKNATAPKNLNEQLDTPELDSPAEGSAKKSADEQLEAVADVLPPETVPLESVPPELQSNRLFLKYKNQYTTPDGIAYLTAIMRRATPYRAFIEAEIANQQAPAWLLYLPVIESGYSVTAVSRSGATGLWQFMRNSIGGYNIRINEWMDERRDPWITTAAAISKLKYNYSYLGDWYLALAAYNCGLGATKKAIKNGGKADYWYLCDKGYFKTETIHYVPKFLAIAEILSRSADYGIVLDPAAELGTLTTIDVKRAIDIELLAKETGMDAAILKTANPSLFYHITPPDTAYALRIPVEQEPTVRSLLEDKNRLMTKYYMYKIKSGDTLYALALHYGITVDMIVQYNPGMKPSALKIGKNIVIPALKNVGSYAGKKDPDSLNFSGTYLVKQGDTLWSIALGHNIQVETLAEKNNLDVNAVLKLGKSLRVPIL